ncbi:hypothetical protein GCM10011375_18810 [Hymenobacter qilianensis]|uniref:Uncharacterized protein n=2 Tax=Hymenobacter qilianensis TaxID=1385715 RepID=A0ACB5PR74_9BACT|nr:hypothetical protein [Hymenobacter qilianensis]QNP52055.1 hypothetical protein H9L05_19515 [Hymenobacter qilianensis]GGF64170.1 hypothetical protein GCM10011375_18810 [Hymenobacter qilianensis]
MNEKRAKAKKMAFSRAVINLFKLKPGVRSLEETNRFAQEALHDYLLRSKISRPDKREEYEAFHEKFSTFENSLGAPIPYYPSYPTWLLPIVEKTLTHEIAVALYKELQRFEDVLVTYYEEVFNAADVYYLRQIVEERINELLVNSDGEDHRLSLPRLEEAKRWLQAFELKMLNESSEVLPPTIDKKIQHKPTDLTLRQVALIAIYQGKVIRNDIRAKQLAEENGHRSPNSGTKLYQRYIEIAQVGDRINVTGKKIKPLINAIESVIPYLNKQQREQADNELSTIRAKIL